MTAINYPVADSADQALHAPRGYAVREREAVQAAGGPVEFVSEAVGPAFVSEAAAVDAYAGTASAPGGWRSLRPVVEGKAPKTRPPQMRDGRRWPVPDAPAGQTLWRLSVSYWRIVSAERLAVPDAAARKLRRDPGAEALDARALRALAHQPLRPAEPQRALDIGLFEVRLPEDPGRLVPDE